ncbi:C39 family peptidase [bacterium]|nr:C39 family peptidase [bacterium]
MKSLVRLFYLSLAFIFAFSSWARADVLLDVPFYSQVDYWSEDELVDDIIPPINIGNAGCMMICFSMALKHYGVNTDPEIFNIWLKSNEGYVIEGVDIGIMKWTTKVKEYAGENGVVVDPKWEDLITGQNYQAIHNELIAGYPVIVKVPYADGH